MADELAVTLRYKALSFACLISQISAREGVVFSEVTESHLFAEELVKVEEKFPQVSDPSSYFL